MENTAMRFHTLDYKSKLSLINRLLKMYYFELDTTPNAEYNYRDLLEIRIDKIKKTRYLLLNGTYKTKVKNTDNLINHLKHMK